MSEPGLPHIVILGGGFGGLYCAKSLAGAPVAITLVDRKNHHVFQPLLYQVATAALDPSDIASPLRQVFADQENVRVIIGDAQAIDAARKIVHLADSDLSYDALVLATGVSHTYFGHDEYARVAPGLKTIEDALEVRRKVFAAFEEAERTLDPVEHKVLFEDGRMIELTPLEFRLLYYLMKNTGRVLNTSQILSKVWGYDYEGESNLVAVYIRRLRTKIEPDAEHPHHVITVRNLGYKFEI